MFLHLTSDSINQLFNTLEDDNRLYLVELPYQKKAPDVANLFTPRSGMPATYAQLRLALRQAVKFLILVRGRDLPAMVKNLFISISERVFKDKLTDFFIDPVQPIGDKNLKPGDSCPKFGSTSRLNFPSFQV
jgi:hypothetical protein